MIVGTTISVWRQTKAADVIPCLVALAAQDHGVKLLRHAAEAVLDRCLHAAGSSGCWALRILAQARKRSNSVLHQTAI